MALGRRYHVFGAVVDDLDWFTRLPREQCSVTGDQRRILFLATKAAARFRLNDADLLGREAKQRNERFVNVVRTLHRTPDRNAVLRVRDRDSAVVLDV